LNLNIFWTENKLRKVTVHYEIRPKNGKRPTTRSRRIHSARQAAKRPEAENGPLALRPRSACQAAMRPETKTGPPALSRSARPTLQATTWAWAGKVSSRLGRNAVRWSWAIYLNPTAARSFRPNKTALDALAQTLALILFFSAPTHAPQWRLFMFARTDEVVSIDSVEVHPRRRSTRGAPTRSWARPHAD
jgi:hypothetical protein